MSEVHAHVERESWLDRYWQLGVILFGLVFVVMLMTLN